MYFAPARGDKPHPDALGPELVANALNNSPDDGVTIVLSKLEATEVSAGAVKYLEKIGKKKPDDESIVERITLGNNQLTTIPLEFASLSRLRYLNLKHNNFTKFPEVVTALPALDTLDISHNKITGFPAQPGQLLHLRVFSFNRNKITHLPTYFPQFRNLEVLRLERNPIEWPPQNVLDAQKPKADSDMRTWIHKLKEWIDYSASNHDDSGYGEHIEIKSTKQGQGWQFPRRALEFDMHSRSFSIDSSVSVASDSFSGAELSTDSGWRQPTSNPFDARQDHLADGAASDKFSARSISLQAEQSDQPFANKSESHTRTSSVTARERQSSDLGPGKHSLPDLRSPLWKKESTNISLPDLPQTLTQSSSKGVAKTTETNTDATATGKPTSVAFERNSYFQRLSVLPRTRNLPPPLQCLVETTRSILFVTSQIYQTIEHYVNHAIDEKHAVVFKRVLEPANADMVHLIQSLDRFDMNSRKGVPSDAVCRALMESCRGTMIVTQKAIGLFAIQLRIAPCEDHRYSRWILLELYASTAEISVAWQNLLPYSEALKGFLSTTIILDPPTNSSTPRNDNVHPAPRLRNNGDLASSRTHNARRHAGSFSHRDLELGKDMPEDQPPSLPTRPPLHALRLLPKRQTTAPASASSALGPTYGFPPTGLSYSKSATEETVTGHRAQPHIEGPVNHRPSVSGQTTTAKLRTAESRQRVDAELVQSTLEAIDAGTPKLWDLVAESSNDPQLQDLLGRARELSRKVGVGLRNSLTDDYSVDTQLSDDILVFYKVVNQISKSNARSRAPLPWVRSTLARLLECLEDLVKVLHLSTNTNNTHTTSMAPGIMRAYSPAFSNPFHATSPPEDNRLGSSLSRTRSAQPSPSAKPHPANGHDGPRSAMPGGAFKIPNLPRMPSRDHWVEPSDPG